MKKINLIYNHNVFDEPYNQNEVKKVEKQIKSQFGNDVEVFIGLTSCSSPNPFVYDMDLIIAEHTFALASEEKSILATILKNSVKKLKSCEPIDVVVSLRKIEEDDLWFFKA